MADKKVERSKFFVRSPRFILDRDMIRGAALRRLTASERKLYAKDGDVPAIVLITAYDTYSEKILMTFSDVDENGDNIFTIFEALEDYINDSPSEDFVYPRQKRLYHMI